MTANEQPPLVVMADRIWTLDDRNPVAEAVAIDGGVIVAIGNRSDVSGWGLGHVETIDLGSATVTPGFVDAHVHPMSGTSWLMNSVSLSGVTELDEAVDRVRKHAATLGPDEWLLAYSMDYRLFLERQISYRPFHEAFGGRPGWLHFFDGHAIIASARALEIAGITGAREFGNNARIGVFDDGRPSGYLVETDAIDLVTRHKPQAPRETRVRAIREQFARFAASGYTGLHQLNYQDGDFDILDEIEADGDIPFRLRISPMWRPNSDWDEHLSKYLAMQGKHGRDWAVEGMKLVIDGTIDNGSAWLHEPDTFGDGTKSYWRSNAEFTKLLHEFARRGIATATHAIGDQGVDFVLDAIASLPQTAPELVHRVEHVESIPDSTVSRFFELGAAASMQPMHILATSADHTDMWSTRLGRGGERANHAWRIADIYRTGAIVALGSDWPVEEFDARQVFATAITRRRANSTLAPIQPQQGLSAEDALRCITQQVWASIGRPDDGVLKPGSVGDLTAFESDPITTDPDEFASTPVVLTVVGGRVAHRAP